MKQQEKMCKNVSMEDEQGEESVKGYLSTVGKGFCVGGSMLVPGVSGGSMAMILGIYDKLIEAVSSFFSHIGWSIKFLLAFSVSAVVGMLLFAKPLLTLIERFPMVMMYFFLGAVFGSVPMIVRKAEVTKIRILDISYILIGLLLMWGISLLPAGMLEMNPEGGVLSYLPMLIAGIVIAVALVLPGISVSYMLLVLGMYEETVTAISEMNLAYLMPLGFGLALGIILTTKILERAMKLHPRPTYLMILGFIIASCIDVFPGVPSGISLIFGTFMFLIGAYLIYRLSKTEEMVS